MIKRLSKVGNSNALILDRALMELVGLPEGAGFIPHGDHRIPRDVSYENYRYYVRNKLAVLGWRADDIAQIEPLRE